MSAASFTPSRSRKTLVRDRVRIRVRGKVRVKVRMGLRVQVEW